MSESTEPIHEGVDEYIYDPIRVSLLATIDDENTAYKDPDKIDRYSLFEAKTIDIWETNQRGPQILDRNYPLSRRLPEDLFEAYHPSAPRGSRLALRLLCTRPVLASNQTARYDDLDRPDDRQVNYLPFVPEGIQDLIHQWDLNREYTWMRLNSREVGNFQRKTGWDFGSNPPRATRMVIHFPFVLRPARRVKWEAQTKKHPASRRTLRSKYNPHRDDPFIWSFAMSHSLRDGKTRGIVDGVTDFAIGDLSRRLLKGRSEWYPHPLHVPVVLLNIFFDHAAWEVNRLCVKVGRFEYLSRDAGIGSLQDFDTITTQLQYTRRSLDFQQSLTKFLLETLKFLETKVFARELSSRDDGISESYRTYVYHTNPHMEEKLKNTLHLIENNLSTCQYLQSRTRDALDFIKGTISLRDNESNREDADSNSTMSFLQMTFLPATFVAAIVSTNFFELSNNPPTVSKYFWIFWVVAIGLTVLTLGIYFLWKRQKKAEAKRQEQEAEQRKKEIGWEEGDSSSSDDTDADGRRRRRRRRRTKTSADDAELGNGNGKKKKEKPELVQ
ncbi:hypothetical protein PV11_07495 [Exophiala sideris]|uniref:Uncharacterized protein n=1 Tax=Exophiala sideris TaxID=1016849 RepID=A0A0D1WXS3_9EURO|nr:hypothetical protein PV11_07495 [Exophiala sideris]